jgi:hypothetical protein
MRRLSHGGGIKFFQAADCILTNYAPNFSFQPGSAPGKGRALAS